MTGYAQARSESAGAAVIVTLKSVNHRFLDLRWNLPPEWEPLAPELEARLRACVRRGHISIRIQGETAPAAAALPVLNPESVRSYLRAHAELSRQLGSTEAPRVRDLLHAPGVFTLALPGAAEAVSPDQVRAAFDDALQQLNRMRRTEGEATVSDLLARCDALDRARAEIDRHRSTLTDALLARLRRRLEELLAGAIPAPERLLQEAATIAERADVSEELTRLAAHLAQFRALLAAGGEVGKKLDFLSQELNREVNTLLSKTSAGIAPALRISETALELKSEIEKIREQVQNLE